MTNLRSLPFALAIVGLFAAQTAPLAQAPDRVAEWTAAVIAHEAGEPRKAALEIASWPAGEVDAVVANVKKQVRELDRGVTGPAFELQRKSREWLVRRDEANSLLLRGAVLHADIAKLIPEDAMRRSPSQASVFAVEDGRQQGIRYPTLHWAVARSLLDGVLPTPAAHPSVLLWYRLTSAHLLRNGVLAGERTHLDRALQLFPNDPEILLDSAYLHEKFASPLLQAAAESVAAFANNRTNLASMRVELGRAERFYRQVLEIQADHPSARVRLGRVLGELGRHREAIVELRKAIDGGAAGPSLYFAELFLGSEEETLGNRDEARERYERAAKLYPRAQSPRLALSQLARRAGDRARARAELQQIANLPLAESSREDPWWTYYETR